MMRFGGAVTARALISLRLQLRVYVVVYVRMSQIRIMPLMSLLTTVWVPLTHFTPIRLWLWPFIKKTRSLT